MPRAAEFHYQHQPGNHSDVVKHVILIQLIKEVQKKHPNGIVLVDTHAGPGIYDVSAQSPPAYRKGVCRAIDEAKYEQQRVFPEAVEDYLSIVSQGNEEEFGWYPGSPILGHQLLRNGVDKHRLCDMHQEDFEALSGKAEFLQCDAFDPDSLDYIYPGDGGENKKHRLIFIDPAYEDDEDYYHAKRLVENILERDPSCTIMLSAPFIKNHKYRWSFSQGLKELAKKKAQVGRFYASLTVGLSGLQGSAVAIFNPPKDFDEVVDDVCMDWLSKALREERSSDFVVEQFMKRQPTK